MNINNTYNRMAEILRREADKARAEGMSDTMIMPLPWMVAEEEETWDDDLEAKYERADNRMRKLVLMARNARMKRVVR